ncbi:MAG: polyphosphate kinase 1 [Vicinamibacterales bacterium]
MTQHTPVAPAVALDAPELYINRELSWLAFNARVLAQARDTRHPLLERVKFLAIVGSNLDEFFMIRVATLQKQLHTSGERVSIDGLTTQQQLALVRDRALSMLTEQGHVWQNELRPDLARQGVVFLAARDYSDGVRAYLADYFQREIAPVLTPLAFDPGHPFPHISNLSMNLAVVVKHEKRTKFARVKLPHVVPRFIQLPSQPGDAATTFAFLEDVVCGNVHALFPGTQVKSAHLFRVVRDTDMVIQEDEADDLLETIDQGLRQLRHGAPSMLHVEERMPRRVVDILVENFEIDEGVLVPTTDRLGFADWMELMKLHRPELKYPPLVPRVVWNRSEAVEVFELVRHRDHMLHHPFDSFTSVETLVSSALNDPAVVAIKMTLYRIGYDSPLINLLVQAAEAGKQVAVLVELKARFDERKNIAWAERLEEAGVHVVYGVVNLKTHAKLCLIVRKDADGIRQYAHIGTGNYNASTARMYTDIGIVTARPAVVADVARVFNYLTGYSSNSEYEALVVAPAGLRRRLCELIDREAAHARDGISGRIIIKINGLTDAAIIQHLYRASQAGVRIDLVVRGICCLRPGVPGVSERITVRSIVDRFLEHSRIFWFDNAGDPDVFIGSADLMERNLDRRVEVLCPVTDPALRAYLRDTVLDVYLRDTGRAWTLDASGEYHPPERDEAEPVNAQEALLARHTNEYQVD